MQEALAEELIQQIGYVIEPKYLFSNMIKEIGKEIREYLIPKCFKRLLML